MPLSQEVVHRRRRDVFDQIAVCSLAPLDNTGWGLLALIVVYAPFEAAERLLCRADLAQKLLP